MQKQPLQAWISLLILAALWGSSFILIKRGLVGLTPWELGALRMVAASVFLLPVAISRLKRVEKEHWKFLASVGLLGSLIPGFLFAFAQMRIDSAIAGVVNALTPIFTILIGLMIYKQKHPTRIFLGILIGFVGTTILALAGKSGGIAFNSYVFFIVLATICYGANTNIIKHHLNKLQALTVTAVSLLIAGPVAVVYLFGFTDFLSKVISSPDVQLAAGYTALLGIMSTAIALSLFNRILQITDPVFASSVTYLIPIVAVIWGVIDNESLLPMHFIGMGTIVLGVYITNRMRT
ncbi:MAG: DMT family transporter [Cytophagales bacterium]|nr:DMT family transporter [Cytophagales bacterium]